MLVRCLPRAELGQLEGLVVQPPDQEEVGVPRKGVGQVETQPRTCGEVVLHFAESAGADPVELRAAAQEGDVRTAVCQAGAIGEIQRQVSASLFRGTAHTEHPRVGPEHVGVLLASSSWSRRPMPDRGREAARPCRTRFPGQRTSGRARRSSTACRRTHLGSVRSCLCSPAVRRSAPGRRSRPRACRRRRSRPRRASGTRTTPRRARSCRPPPSSAPWSRSCPG